MRSVRGWVCVQFRLLCDTMIHVFVYDRLKAVYYCSDLDVDENVDVPSGSCPDMPVMADWE